MQYLEEAQSNARKWIDGNYDDDTKNQVQSLLDADDKTALIDSFYKNLEFGTGGLRGIMGVGTNRVNIYTVGAATQGFAEYLVEIFGSDASVVIGYDPRINNKLFAQTTADVMSANGVKVYLFEDLRPTPEISFAIRELKCKGGVIVTASHNPKEYNGYKVYWDDGSQIVPPHDKNIIERVNGVTVDDIKFDRNESLIETIGSEIDQKYLGALHGLSLSPESIQKNKDLPIVFSPLHGSTYKMVPECLKKFGFENVHKVAAQNSPDGSFPTVGYANPEEAAAFEMAVTLAVKTNSELVMACDPDGDRMGVGITNPHGDIMLINGNQSAAILTEYLIARHKEKGTLREDHYVGKTIVTSEILREIANKNGVTCYDTYTGFKWIAELIRLKENETYLGGGEESYGYLVGDIVRDKDAVSACAMTAEAAAWAKDKGMSLYELLMNIYIQYGYSKEKLVSINKTGAAGAQEIKDMMHRLRHQYPKSFDGVSVLRFLDYQSLTEVNLETGQSIDLDYNQPSNVLQFILTDGSKISVRPSGTEPKIKFYFEVKDKMSSADEFNSLEEKSLQRIDRMIAEITK